MDAFCYEAVSVAANFGCQVSCSGLYADVQFTEDKVVRDSIPGEVALSGEDSLGEINMCNFL